MLLRQKFKILWIVVLTLSCLGVIQFLVITTLAVLNYPDGFSFTRNYLSELGRQATTYGDWYSGALIFLGISLIPSFSLLWATNTNQLWSMRAASMFGIISSFGLIGMGIAPVDRDFIAHYASLAIWMFPMVYMTVSFFFAVSHSRYAGIGFISASFITVVIMIYVLMQTDLTSLQLLHISVVAFGSIWLLYILFFIYQAGYKMLKEWHLHHDYSDVENRYFSRITRNLRR